MLFLTETRLQLQQADISRGSTRDPREAKRFQAGVTQGREKLPTLRSDISKFDHTCALYQEESMSRSAKSDGDFKSVHQ